MQTGRHRSNEAVCLFERLICGRDCSDCEVGHTADFATCDHCPVVNTETKKATKICEQNCIWHLAVAVKFPMLPARRPPTSPTAMAVPRAWGCMQSGQSTHKTRPRLAVTRNWSLCYLCGVKCGGGSVVALIIIAVPACDVHSCTISFDLWAPRYHKVGQFITAVFLNLTFRTTSFGGFNPGLESFERTPVYRTSVYNPSYN